MFDFLSRKFASIFEHVNGYQSISQENSATTLASIEEALLEADVPYQVVQAFLEQMRPALVGQKVPSGVSVQDFVLRTIYEKVLAFLGGKQTVGFAFHVPSVVMMMGLQGAGKTTTLMKLVNYVVTQAQKKNKSRSVLVASLDFYRPAAIEQLEVLSRLVPCTFYRAHASTVIEAAKEIYAEFKRGGYDLLFLDTAGRLHVDAGLLDELVTVEKIMSPKHKLLVLDAMTGQESMAIAQAFEQKVGFHAAILTKMDSDTRGGAAFGFRFVLKKPILFGCTGEKIADLQEFHPDRIAQRMLNMGDVQSLMERADQSIKFEQQQKMSNMFKTGVFTFEDFALQIDMVGSMGSLSSLMQYIPGVANKISKEQLTSGQEEIKKIRAIISSMTAKERLNQVLLDESRQKRVANGAGVTHHEVKLLMQRFEQAQQYVKLFRKSGPFKGLFR